MSRRSLFQAIPFLLILASLLLSACQGQADPQPPKTDDPVQPVVAEASWEDAKSIKIIVPTLLTGYGAPMGADIQAGISLAVEEVNEAGGVLGKPIEMIVSDIKDSGAEDCRMAAELMERVGAVAAFPGALYGPACVHEFGAYHQPFFHASAIQETVDVVIATPAYNNIFMTSASELAYSPNNFEIFTEKLPYEWPNKKVALLGGDITYDMLIQKSFAQIAEENGWEIVLNDTYPYGTTDFGAQLSKIRAEKPALIYGVITSTDSSVAFMNQFLENPTDSIIYIQWSPASPEFIGLLGDKANGILWSTLYAYLHNPENEEYIQKFEARFGRAPGAAWPFVIDDQLHLWIAAVESCGSPVDYACINDYLAKLNDHPYDGRVGVYGNNPEGNVGLTGDEWIPIHFFQIQEQQNKDLYLGTTEADTPFMLPPWMK